MDAAAGKGHSSRMRPGRSDLLAVLGISAVALSPMAITPGDCSVSRSRNCSWWSSEWGGVLGSPCRGRPCRGQSSRPGAVRHPVHRPPCASAEPMVSLRGSDRLADLHPVHCGQALNSSARHRRPDGYEAPNRESP